MAAFAVTVNGQVARVGAGVGAGVGATVGARVGAAVGSGVGVGAAVGSGVGTDVGAVVGAGVGAGVGADVGAGVGAGVGAAVGVLVRVVFVPAVGSGSGSGSVSGSGPVSGAGPVPGSRVCSPLSDTSSATQWHSSPVMLVATTLLVSPQSHVASTASGGNPRAPGELSLCISSVVHRQRSPTAQSVSKVHPEASPNTTSAAMQLRRKRSIFTKYECTVPTWGVGFVFEEQRKGIRVG